MVDVFISYSRQDQEMVAVLAHAIEAEGYDVWWDAELPPHKSYGEVITAKIAATKAAVVVWSPDAAASEWVRAEADMARNHRKLIQTSLGKTMPPLPFNQIQYADLDGWRGEEDHPGWRKVKRSLETLCGPGSVAPEATRAGQASPPPPSTPEPSPHFEPPPRQVSTARNWPLFAGIAIAVVALAVALGVFLGQRTSIRQVVPTWVGSGEAEGQPSPEVAPEPISSTAADAAAEAEPAIGEEIAPEPDPADLTFPDSSTRLLTRAEVAQLGPATLRVARNEIYARKGRRFHDRWLTDYFSRYDWYRPRYDEVRLNPIERRNVALIQQAEARYR